MAKTNELRLAGKGSRSLGSAAGKLKKEVRSLLCSSQIGFASANSVRSLLDPSSPQPRPAPKSQSHFSTPLRGRALLSPSRSPPPPRTTTSSLLPHLRRFAEDSSSSPTPPDEVAAVLAGERALEVTGTQEEVEEVSSRLMSPATTLEQGVEIATRVLKATETSREDLGTRGLVYSLIHDLHQLVERIHPRPSPVPLLDFFVPRQGRIRLTFNASQNPLVSLLEIYSRLYAQDRRRLDPRSEAPSPGVVVELESLRVEHLAAVRDIHSARKETTAWKSTVRSETTLMGAYNQGRSFEEVWEIWGAMKAEGGVGLDHRAVAVVSLSSVRPLAIEANSNLIVS